MPPFTRSAARMLLAASQNAEQPPRPPTISSTAAVALPKPSRKRTRRDEDADEDLQANPPPKKRLQKQLKIIPNENILRQKAGAEPAMHPTTTQTIASTDVSRKRTRDSTDEDAEQQTRPQKRLRQFMPKSSNQEADLENMPPEALVSTAPRSCPYKIMRGYNHKGIRTDLFQLDGRTRWIMEGSLEAGALDEDRVAATLEGIKDGTVQYEKAGYQKESSAKAPSFSRISETPTEVLDPIGGPVAVDKAFYEPAGDATGNALPSRRPCNSTKASSKTVKKASRVSASGAVTKPNSHKGKAPRQSKRSGTATQVAKVYTSIDASKSLDPDVPVKSVEADDLEPSDAVHRSARLRAHRAWSSPVCNSEEREIPYLSGLRRRVDNRPENSHQREFALWREKNDFYNVREMIRLELTKRGSGVFLLRNITLKRLQELWPETDEWRERYADFYPDHAVSEEEVVNRFANIFPNQPARGEVVIIDRR